MHFVLVLLNMPFLYESKPFMHLRHTDLQHLFIFCFLYDILFFTIEEFYKLKYCSTVVYMVPRA